VSQNPVRASGLELFEDALTKAEASKLIDEMREKANVPRERVMEDR
jgi:hypothetical protein